MRALWLLPCALLMGCDVTVHTDTPCIPVDVSRPEAPSAPGLTVPRDNAPDAPGVPTGRTPAPQAP